MSTLDELLSEKIAVALAPLKQDIAYLKATLTEWVSTKEASRITGKSRATLEKARDRNEIQYKKDGRTVTYNRQSLLNYCQKKGIGPEEIKLRKAA